MIADNIKAFIAGSSWIREMFEIGIKLKAEHGPESVYDFSLGNPNLDPPLEFKQALKATVDETGPMGHAYMPNTGYPHVRKAVADSLAAELHKDISENDIVMTCGAAGALNIILKTLLNPGDEVITPAPYFVEYNFYTPNHGGVLKTVPTQPDFKLDKEFVSELQKELILAVPGSGFGGPGHFRLSFCVDDDTIVKAMPGFKRAMDKYR